MEQKSKISSKQSEASNYSSFYTPYPINQKKQKQEAIKNIQDIITPINPKKTIPIQNQYVDKFKLQNEEIYSKQQKEIDKYNYQCKKTLTPQYIESHYEKNNNYQNQQKQKINDNYLKYKECNKDSNINSLQFSKLFNQQSNYMNRSLNQSNLQFSKILNQSYQVGLGVSKIQSIPSSTLDHEWLSDASNFVSQESHLVFQNQQQIKANWIIFVNENGSMKFSKTITLQNLKFYCVQIDGNFFDDYEYILFSDQYKILILEQKELVTPEIHMRLSRGDEKGAIQSLINKLKILMQQFMIQYNNRQIVVMIQYQNQFFYRMLQEYIFPQLGSLKQQYRITPFNQIEELQELMLDLIQNQEQLRYDRFLKIQQDLQKFRAKISEIDFSSLVTMRSLNQLYSHLVQQLIC